MFFQNFSMTGTGIVALCVGYFLRANGIDATDESVAGVINAFVLAAGWAFTLWGQFRRNDVKYGLIRK